MSGITTAFRTLLAVAGAWFLIAALVSSLGGPCLLAKGSIACSFNPDKGRAVLQEGK